MVSGNLGDNASGLTPFIIKALVFAIIAVFGAILTFTIMRNGTQWGTDIMNNAIEAGIGAPADIAGIKGGNNSDLTSVENNLSNIDPEGLSIREQFSWGN